MPIVARASSPIAGDEPAVLEEGNSAAVVMPVKQGETRVLSLRRCLQPEACRANASKLTIRVVSRDRSVLLHAIQDCRR
jgi:hypothetical protein